MNVIEWLTFEFAYFNAAVRHFGGYAIGTPPYKVVLSRLAGEAGQDPITHLQSYSHQIFSGYSWVVEYVF